MNTTTRAGRVQYALRLLADLEPQHRASDDPQSEGPRGDCGRDENQPCGMIDRSECRTHADPADGDPETLNYGGTLQQRRQQLRAARRHGLRH
jgi:hypothetical protein